MNVSVLGGGIMGSGIVQIAACAGHDVWVLDVDDPQLDRARAMIESSLARLATKEVFTPEDCEQALSRLRFTSVLAEAVGDADVVVEAVPEKLELKQALLSEAARLAPADCLLGTKTRVSCQSRPPAQRLAVPSSALWACTSSIRRP